MFKKIIKTFSNTWLCLKYPFLYPRSRYTDKHYTNRVINNKIYELRTKYLWYMPIEIMTSEEFNNELIKENVQEDDKYPRKSFIALLDINGYSLSVVRYWLGKGIMEVVIKNNRNGECVYKKFDINHYLDRTDITSDDITHICFKNYITKDFMGKINQSPHIVFVLKDGLKNLYKCPSFNLVKIDLLGYTNVYIKLLEWINTFLGWFHILPSYTELDAMEKGWRIKFGEDMCREIRNSLLTTYIRNEKPNSLFGKVEAYYKGFKLLFSYRILQIKEKYSGLRWYANGDTEDTLKIIHKYEDMSKRTCIVCGKEAEWRSVGWICPYCEEHKPDTAVKIGEDDDWF